MLLRAVIHHTKAHFTRIRCSKKLDTATVKFRTDSLLWIQSDAFRLPFVLKHKITSSVMVPLSAPLYNRKNLW